MSRSSKDKFFHKQHIPKLENKLKNLEKDNKRLIKIIENNKDTKIIVENIADSVIDLAKGLTLLTETLYDLNKSAEKIDEPLEVETPSLEFVRG